MTVWAEHAMPHLVAVPVLLPLLTAAAMLLLGGKRRSQAVLGGVSCIGGLLVGMALLRWVDASGATGAVAVYLPGNWSVPFGIVLAADRLSALMLVVTAILAVAAVTFAAARWDRAGVHFHTLFQIQLMGLNGAFLTADLFNLFVFFEVTLAASYGLLLHGSGPRRARAGLHYIAMNLLASSFFLVGVAMLYGVTGTLNMADMARKLPSIPAEDVGLLHAGASILGIAFLIKAAAWPLNFWLTRAYAAAGAPVAALFAVLTKVGVYSLLRIWTLMLRPQDKLDTPFAGEVLTLVGLATLALSAVGILTAQQPRRLAAFCIVISAGTLLAATGFSSAALLGGALYYLVASTLAAGALFLVAELIERSREAHDRLETLRDDEADFAPTYVVADVPRSPEQVEDEAPVGRVIAGPMAFLGLCFAGCALLVAGLPPMPGFLAKFAMLDPLMQLSGAVPATAWTMLVLLIVSGLLSTLAFSRAGVRFFWAPSGRPLPRLRIIETAPIAGLLLLMVALTVFAEPVLRFSRSAASSLLDPAPYIQAIMSAVPKSR
ncbi:MAG TPA: monovalent cation/H+ antiporter subunit D [Usitatibacter sp.]|nr:monovalent cation/H+ antiporter subunit D [Usitatibacter sp.]